MEILKTNELFTLVKHFIEIFLVQKMQNQLKNIYLISCQNAVYYSTNALDHGLKMFLSLIFYGSFIWSERISKITFL